MTNVYLVNNNNDNYYYYYYFVVVVVVVVVGVGVMMRMEWIEVRAS